MPFGAYSDKIIRFIRFSAMPSPDGPQLIKELYIMEIFFHFAPGRTPIFAGSGDSEARSSTALIPGPNLKSYDL